MYLPARIKSVYGEPESTNLLNAGVCSIHCLGHRNNSAKEARLRTFLIVDGLERHGLEVTISSDDLQKLKWKEPTPEILDNASPHDLVSEAYVEARKKNADKKQVVDKITNQMLGLIKEVLNNKIPEL